MAVRQAAGASRAPGPPAREVAGRHQHISVTARAISGTLDRIHALIAPHPATIRVFLCDRMGRLRLVDLRGREVDPVQEHTARRRAAFQTGTACRVPPRPRHKGALGILPLVVGAETLGVVEVQTDETVLDARWEALLIAASESALLIREDRDLADFKTDLDAASATSLAGELMRAASPRGAVVAVVDFYFEWFKVPVAAWLSEAPGTDPELVGVRALDPGDEEAIRHRMPSVPRWECLTLEQRDEVMGTFAELAGVREASVLRAGPAVLLAGGPWRSLRRSLDVLANLLEDAFDHLATVGWAQRRNEDLDLALAMTAHELRGPLVGAKVAVDRSAVLTDEPSAHELLRRSSQELQFLSGLAESLLRWAAGRPSLREAETDLSILARQAIESCRLELGLGHVVSLRSEGPVMVRGDSAHLRTAIANLVRNALVHTAPGTRTVVTVSTHGEVVRLTVRDRGPGVPLDERERIFDPFVRGRGARDGGGTGLGLFITRKIAEAHGGRIWAESASNGATFVLEVPSALPT